MNIRRFITLVAAGACLLLAPALVLAQSKTALVAAISPYDDLVSDLEYLGELGERPQLADSMQGMIGFMTGGKGLAGLDTSRPWGVIISVDDEQFTYVGVLPTSDLSKLLDALQNIVGPAKKEGDMYVVTAPQQQMPLYLKENSSWTYISTSPAQFENLPNDPGAELAALASSYDIGVKAFAANIPANYKQTAVGMIKQGMEQGMQKLPEESDAQHQARVQMMQQQLAELDRAINEIDEFEVGLAIDAPGQEAYLEMVFKLLPGTQSAAELADIEIPEPKFPGLLDQAASVIGRVGVVIPEEQREEAVQQLEPMRKQVEMQIDEESDIPTEEAKQFAKDIANEFIDHLAATIRSGLLDMGGKLVLSDDKLALVAGGHVADGEAVEKTLRKLEAMVKEDPNFPGIQWDAASQSGVSFHTMAIPVPDEKARQIFGDNLDVIFGTGPQAAFLALGSDAQTHLKSAIDGGAAASLVDGERKPMQGRAALTPIFEFAANVSNEANLESMAAELRRSGDKDHVTLDVEVIENGETIRFAVEEGVLRLLMKADQFAN